MDMITSINASTYALRASLNMAVRTESAEKTEFMSEDEKLDAFKKEIWKELDSMPWNSSVNVSIQITDSAFRRMMTDEDFKNRMMRIMHEEASVCRSPIVSSINCIDENGYKGVSYNDYDMANIAFKAHSKNKDSFYVKKAKAKEVNDAWEKAQRRRDKQREIRENEYWNKYFANKTFVHQEQVASLYESSIPEVKTQDMINMESLAEKFG